METRDSDGLIPPGPAEPLATRLRTVAALVGTQARGGPWQAAGLLEALGEAGCCLAEAERRMSEEGAAVVAGLRPALEQWQAELRRAAVLVEGALGLVGGWSRSVGLAPAYGAGRRDGAVQVARVNELG